MSVSITPDVPFSLDAAAAFGFGPNMGRPSPDGGVMRLASSPMISVITRASS